MASEKQIRANRANARKSTGPKSLQGLARSSRNALVHGLSLPLAAEDLVLAGELAQALFDSHSELAAELALSHLEIRRARTTRLAALQALLSPDRLFSTTDSIPSIINMERYERVAGQKRRRALRKMRVRAASSL